MLINSNKLSDSKTEQLQSILQDHHDLAVCYAMKEEMCRLYELTDYQQAVIGWTKWFQAAKESEIPALVRFAVQKEKRLPGLARPVDEAIEGNAQLNYPSKMNPHRDKFLNMYKNYGFEKAAEAVYSDEIKKQKTIVKKNEIKNLARAYINKLLRR